MTIITTKGILGQTEIPKVGSNKNSAKYSVMSNVSISGHWHIISYFTYPGTNAPVDLPSSVHISHPDDFLKSATRIPGLHKGMINPSEDFDAPLSEDLSLDDL